MSARNEPCEEDLTLYGLETEAAYSESDRDKRRPRLR